MSYIPTKYRKYVINSTQYQKFLWSFLKWMQEKFKLEMVPDPKNTNPVVPGKSENRVFLESGTISTIILPQYDWSELLRIQSINEHNQINSEMKIEPKSIWNTITRNQSSDGNRLSWNKSNWNERNDWKRKSIGRNK